MDSFSEQLRAEAEPMWKQIFAQPFLREIKDGTLPLEKFQYYLGQDYLYLEGFARTVCMALAKAPDSQTLEELAHRVMTPVERPLHHKRVFQQTTVPPITQTLSVSNVFFGWFLSF